MTTPYRAGQRVRVEWPDGSAAEGVVEWSNANGWAMPLGDIYVGLDALAAKPTRITVLAESRPAEPVGLGAVVHDGAGVLHVRIWDAPYPWVPVGPPIAPSKWEQLPLPITIRSEGWTP